MPPLKVPERYRAAIVKLAHLNEESFAQLFHALSEAPTNCQTIPELSKWISNETRSISDQDRRKIIDALASMCRVQKNAGVSTAKFANDVWSSLEREAPQLVRDVSDETLKSRVASLLEIPVLSLPSVKALDLKGEVERSFCSVRILTDLRPAFSDDPEVEPSSMVLLHTLQLGFHDDRGKHREFYISMDAEDISKLKSAVERAEKKEETLRSALAAKGVKIFD